MRSVQQFSEFFAEQEFISINAIFCEFIDPNNSRKCNLDETASKSSKTEKYQSWEDLWHVRILQAIFGPEKNLLTFLMRSTLKTSRKVH